MKSKVNTVTGLQKDKIAKVIRKDATLRSRYYGEWPGDFCVIGGLLDAAGVNVREFLGEKYNTWDIGAYNDVIMEAKETLFKEYGLNSTQCAALQRINDSCVNIKSRRKELLAALEEME